MFDWDKNYLFGWGYPNCFDCINSDIEYWHDVWCAGMGGPSDEVANCRCFGHYNALEYQNVISHGYPGYREEDPMDTSHCDLYLFEDNKPVVYN
jgi:hypothetical protein